LISVLHFSSIVSRLILCAIALLVLFPDFAILPSCTLCIFLRMTNLYPSTWNYNPGFRLSGTQDKNLITYTSKLAGVTEAWTKFSGRRPSFDGFEIGCLVTVVQISWEIHPKFRCYLACGPAVKARWKHYHSCEASHRPLLAPVKCRPTQMALPRTLAKFPRDCLVNHFYN